MTTEQVTLTPMWTKLGMDGASWEGELAPGTKLLIIRNPDYRGHRDPSHLAVIRRTEDAQVVGRLAPRIIDEGAATEPGQLPLIPDDDRVMGQWSYIARTAEAFNG